MSFLVIFYHHTWDRSIALSSYASVPAEVSLELASTKRLKNQARDILCHRGDWWSFFMAKVSSPSVWRH